MRSNGELDELPEADRRLGVLARAGLAPGPGLELARGPFITSSPFAPTRSAGLALISAVPSETQDLHRWYKATDLISRKVRI